MVNRFKTDPSVIEAYFDVDTIRNQEQLIFVKSVAAKGKANLMKHTFAATDSIKITNDGTVSLEFYLTNTVDGDPINQKVAVEPSATQTFVITDLGTIDSTFLNVRNPNANDGRCKVELL